MKKLLLLLLFPLSLFAQDGIIKSDSGKLAFSSMRIIGGAIPGTTLEMRSDYAHPVWQFYNCPYYHPDYVHGPDVFCEEAAKAKQKDAANKIQLLEDRVKTLEAKIDLLIQLIKKE